MDEKPAETKTTRTRKTPASTAKRSVSQRASAAKMRANGKAGNNDNNTRNTKSPPERRRSPDRRRRRDELVDNLPSITTLGQIALGAAAVVGAAVVAWQRYRDYLDTNDDKSPSAFHRDEAYDDNFDQTRSAGPDAMRDNPGDDWDEVDQQLDESFPASDPPGSYAGPQR